LCRRRRGVKVLPWAGAMPTSTGLVEVTTLLLELNVPAVRNSRPLKSWVAGARRSSSFSMCSGEVRRLGERIVWGLRELNHFFHANRWLVMQSFLFGRGVEATAFDTVPIARRVTAFFRAGAAPVTGTRYLVQRHERGARPERLSCRTPVCPRS